MKIVTIKLRLTYLRVYTSFNLSDLFIYLLEETSNVFKKDIYTRVYKYISEITRFTG